NRRTGKRAPRRGPPGRPPFTDLRPARPLLLASLGVGFAAASGGQRRDEGLLRDVHPPDGLHPLLALLLPLQQLPLTRDVAAVALGEDVLADGADVLPRDDPG